MTARTPEGPRAFACTDDLDAWLAERPAPHPGLWVKVAKKGSGIVSVDWVEVNDVALCHGWITGRRKALDASHFLQKITPRRPGSLWSMVNVRRVAELTADGRMRPAGLAEVAAAQADGRWAAAYASQREADVPEDLASALERHPEAGAAFEALGRTARYQVIFTLLTARTRKGRTARLEAAIARLSLPPPPSRTSSAG
ncbi:YdeI/OmpD-associated family protein [Streptomyces sp. NPDC005648]|uniref:YdeI/OmpD-associated family protein n=1 Tax=Streptomyces sp. NPDC005648 TaxID=3157044 RepID=UPI0033A4B2DA